MKTHKCQGIIFAIGITTFRQVKNSYECTRLKVYRVIRGYRGIITELQVYEVIEVIHRVIG